MKSTLAPPRVVSSMQGADSMCKLLLYGFGRQARTVSVRCVRVRRIHCSYLNIKPPWALPTNMRIGLL